MDIIPCIDGYPLRRGWPLADAHEALNVYLVRYDEAGWKVAIAELNKIRDKALKLRIWRALLERLAWLHANGGPRGAGFERLWPLTEKIEKWTLTPGDTDLCELLQQTADLTNIVPPYTPIPHVMAYVAEHGLTPALSSAIEDFRERVRGATLTINQVQWQLLWSRLDMLAWRNEWDEVDLARCWSERIRADLRRLRGAERDAWRRLLHGIDGDQGPRPAPSWQKSAAAIVQELTPAAFAARLTTWLEPLQPGATVRLSRPGGHLLRALIWIGATLDDAPLETAIARIAGVRFTPKRNGDKVLFAISDAAGTPPPAPAAAPRPVPALDDLVVRALKAVLSPGSSAFVTAALAERIAFDGPVVRIRGDLDRYRLHVSTGQVFRESDGRQIDVAVEDQPLPLPASGVAGNLAELLAQVLILADDAKRRREIAVME